MPDDDNTDTDETEQMAEAMALWERHMQAAARQWREGVEESADEYRRGLADGLGVDPEDIPDETVEHWKESVANVDPDEFAASISGEGSDWLVGFYRAETGEDPPEEVREEARRIEQEALDAAGDDATDEEIVAEIRDVVQQRADEHAAG